jgi:hypothetical protein
MAKEIDGLKKILDSAQQQRIYPCIRDVLSNEFAFKRFTSGESFPTRQDITNFILAWLKHIGVSADRCRNWMLSYSVRVLSRISSSSPSSIRHSTKYFIKHVYRSDDDAFDCGCEQNEINAACDPYCPVYGEMKKKYQIRMNQLHDTINNVRRLVQPPAESLLQVKERYREQFEKAMNDVREHLNQVSSLDEIIQYLNDQGYKTRTGRPWKTSILRNEIKKHHLSFSSKNNKDAKAYEAVKTRYRAQYQDAVKLIARLYQNGVKVKEIPGALEAKRYRTITGMKWTEASVRNTIRKLQKKIV